MSDRNVKIMSFESEMRRRIWLAVEVDDLMYSLQREMPTIIHDEESDVLPLSNLFDESSNVDTRISCQRRDPKQRSQLTP